MQANAILIERTISNSTPRTTARQSPACDGIRHDLVARIRAEIAAGTYDTPERLELALDYFEQSL